ncbi:MAG: iron chelate uptake ABC transporter family permease subunit, partial [Vicinamibacteria bacterium]
RLFHQREVDWQSRGHFFAIAAQLMRRILVDHARRNLREKHGGRAVRVDLDQARAVPGDGVLDPLDALALGDDVARGLGFRLLPTRAAASAVIVVLAGTATALAGPIVFVGLVGAHAARALVGGGHAARMPVAAVAGAALVLLADVLGRLAVPPGELEAGIVVAVLGAPLLIA